MPGRKTPPRGYPKDSEWLADLLRHGLLKGGFVPDRPQRERRELTRYRTALLQERTAEVNRIQKTLEGANIKLAAVATNVLGKSGREILAALVAGTTEAAPLPDGHLASWAGMSPGNHERAGKRLSGATRTGNPWLRAALVEAGQAAGRTKQSDLGAQFRRLVARRGKERAAVAVGHSILVIADHLLTEDGTDQELGVHYFDQRQQQAVERRLVRRLADLGDKVTLEPTAA